VVWGDFQCPFCAKMVPVLAHLRQKFPTEVRIVYRHLAIAFHRKAVLAAEAGVAAAAQGKFWAFHDQVYANVRAREIDRKDLERHAAAAGLDMAKFRAALDDRRHHDAVLAETASAEALGVDGTPTLFVNGRPLIGSREPAAMERIIEEHLAAARGAVQAGIAATDLYAVAMSGAKGVERADPSGVPDLGAVRVTLRSEDLGRAVVAACRRRDIARATQLAGTLAGEFRRRTLAVCAANGIDL
jgi:predicted DsbA family dithiol-disulfide isomerase